MDPNSIILVGVPAVVLIPLIVQAAKGLGMPPAGAPWLTLVLSVISAVVFALLNSFPTITPYVSVVISSIVLYLVTTGEYHTVKNVASSVNKEKDAAPV